MKTEFKYETYSKVLRDNMKQYELTEPKLIPIPDEEKVLIFKDGIVYCPTLQSSKEMEEGKSVPKVVKELAKTSKYVIYSKERIIGTDKVILANFDFQPRWKPYIWLIVDRKDDKLYWFKEYASSSAVQDFIASLMVINVDNIAASDEVTDIGKYVYKELYAEILGFNLWYNSDSFTILLEVNSSTWNSPFYTYNIRKFFGEVI